MCLILFSFKKEKSYPLVLAANRDEFYDRATAAMDYWEDAPFILAGRDLEQGGTWMGVHVRGRFAALTNFRDPSMNKTQAPSRGNIIPEFLESRSPVETFLKTLDRQADRYNGFNLLAGEIRNRDIRLYGYSSRTRQTVAVRPGIHGISNALIDTDWPKVSRGKLLLEQALNPARTQRDIPTPGQPDNQTLFSILEDTWKPADADLPHTGVGLDWERLLSTLFIQGPTYGTRSSTILTISREEEFTITERTHSQPPGAQKTDRKFRFRPDPDQRPKGSIVCRQSIPSTHS